MNNYSIDALAALAERDVKIRSQYYRGVQLGLMAPEVCLRFVALQHGITAERVREIVSVESQPVLVDQPR